MSEITTERGKIQLNDKPSNCPNCHRSITPNLLYGHINQNLNRVEAFMYCPDIDCGEAFIAMYDVDTRNGCDFSGETSKGSLIGKEFSDTIKNISISFVSIYNESFIAEQQHLTEICGVGYRKALEFLIKDYAIKTYPDKKEAIEKKLLGSCINDYVDDVRIKSVAKRAAWLGNDETHYSRKWAGKNLADLKKLIELTIHWIEMETLTNSFEEEMPE